MSGWCLRFERRLLVLGCAAFLTVAVPPQASEPARVPAAVGDHGQQPSTPSGVAFLRGLLADWRDRLEKDQAYAAEQKRVYAAHLEQHPDSPVDPSLREANQAVGRVSAEWTIIQDLERGLGQLERTAAGPSPAGKPSGTAELASLEAEQSLLIELLAAWQKRKADAAERAARLKAEYAAHVRANPGSVVDRTGAEANQAVGEAEIADRFLVQISSRVAGLTDQVAKARQALESLPPPIETQPPRPGTPPGEVPPLNPQPPRPPTATGGTVPPITPQPPRPPTTGSGSPGGPPAPPTAPASPQPTGPRTFGVTASDIWEGEVTERGIHLTRREAAVTGTRKSYESSAILPYKAAVTGRFTATLSRESYRTAEDIRARYAKYVGSRGYTEVRPITFDGFQGFALVKPAAAAATACWMGGPACATAGAEIQGAAIRDGVAVDVAGLLNGSSGCPTEQADHTSFLLAQVNAGVSEVWAMIASLKVSAGAVRVTTKYTGPPLNSAKTPRVILTPPGLDRLNVGDTVAVRATVEDAEPGDAPFRFAWTGDHEGQGDTVTIRASKPGKYTLTVAASGGRGSVGSASLTYTVERLEVRVVRESPASGPVPLGARAGFRAVVTSGGKPARGPFTFRWQPHPEVSFDNLDAADPTVTAVFPRPGSVKLWVQLLQDRDGRLATMAESEQIEIGVEPPTLELSFQPTSPLVGEEVTARVVVRPDSGAVDIRWLPLGAPAKQLSASKDGRSITFYADRAGSVAVQALARVPSFGDDLGDVKDSITIGAYDVRINVPPRHYGPPPQIWKEGYGLVDVPRNQFAVHQIVEYSTTITPAPRTGPVRYEWSTQGPCRVSNPLYAEARFTASAVTPPCQLSVTVRDRNGAVLDGDTITVDGIIPESAINEAKARAQQAAEAQGARETAGKLRGEGQALQQQGKLREAAAKYKESLKHVPDPELERYIATVEAAAAQQEEAARQAAEAEKQKRAQAQAARETAGKLRAEGQALQQQGKLREAVAKYKESLKHVPDPELERYIAQVEAAATRQEEAARAEEAKRVAEAARAERERREEAARKAEEARKAAEAQRAAETAQAERERREQAEREAERKRQEAEKQAQASAQKPPPPTPPTFQGNMWVRVGVERDEYKADPNNPWTRGCAWESSGQPGQVTATTGAPGKGPYLTGSASWTEPPATLAPDAPVRMNLSLGMTSGANPGGQYLTAQCYFQAFGLEWNIGTASKLQQGTKDAVRVDQSTKPGAGDLLSGQITPLGSTYARDGKIQLRCMVRAGCGSVSYLYIYEWRPKSAPNGQAAPGGLPAAASSR